MTKKRNFECTEEMLRGAMVALDVDGTLTEGLNHDVEKNYCDVVEMLKFLYSSGVSEVCMATGRPPWSAREWFLNCFDGDLDEETLEVKARFMDTMHLFFDGALICDLHGNIVFDNPISFDAVSQVSEILGDEGVNYGFDTKGKYFVSEGYDEVYFPAEEYYDVSEMGMESAYTGYMINLKSEGKVREICGRINDVVPEVEGHYFKSFQGGHCAVINPVGVNKMFGLSKRAEIVGDFEGMIFFGDGSNDLPVFEESLSDERICAVPSPYTRDGARILEVSKWLKPEAGSVLEVLWGH